MSSFLMMPSAKSAARPVGTGPSAPVAPLPPAMKPLPAKKAVGGAGAATVLPSAIVKEERVRGRPSKDEKRIERRMEINANISDLVEDKPTKQKVRIYLLARIQELLVERGIATL